MRRRLSEKKPIIWYKFRKHYLFDEFGVRKITENSSYLESGSFTWTMVDSDESKDVPPHLIAHGMHLFVIYVTSPARERWHRMHHTVHDAVVVMNPWKRKEIHRA